MARPAAALALIALLACDRTHQAPAPVPGPGAIHVIATVNSLDQSCEVGGGWSSPALRLDGADAGQFYPNGRLVDDVAPGAHEVVARCLTCDGTVLGEATARVLVASGATSEVRLDVVVPVAEGAVTITWDAATCRATDAFVQANAYSAGRQTTCRFTHVSCNDGRARVLHLLPGTYSLTFCEALTCELCCGTASAIVVPEGPVAPDAIVVGPLARSCVGVWCPR